MAIQVTYYVYDDAEEMSRHMARLMTDALGAAAARRSVARVAVSGGNTPRRSFEMLADEGQPFRGQMPWTKLEFFFVDERCVPPDNRESNFRMVNEALLKHVPLPTEQIFRMEGELPPEEAASRYESAIRNRLRLEGAETPVFDMVTLGMGDDGHTASLFPHTAALGEMMRICVANHVPQKDTWRITLTQPVLIRAREVVFLIAGADKAQPLHEVLLGAYNPDEFPAQLIRPANGKLTMLLDRAAAEKLPAPVDGKGILEIKR